MAFYSDDDDEEQQDPNQEGGPQATSPDTGLITGTSAGGGSTNAPAAPNAAGSPDKGGNFVGLQTYLDANKNQSKKLGEQTAGVVSNSVNQARDSVSGLNQKFDQAVNQNTVNNDQNITNQIGQAPQSLNDQQRAQAKKQYNAQYTGPAALSDLGDDYSSAMKSTNLANQNLGASQTEEGRGSLINQINSAPRTKGATTFDNVLLQKGAGRDAIQNLVNQNMDVKDLMTNAQTAAQQKVGMPDDPNTPDIDESSGAIGTTAKTKADTMKSVQDALNAWKGGFDTKLAAAQDTGLQDRITKDVGDDDGYLDFETMRELGVDPNDRIYNLKLNDYLNPFSVGDVNAANVASADDYAQYGALADISGEQDPFLKQEDVGKAGTAGKFSVNSDKLRQDIKSSKAAYDSDFANDRAFIGPYAGALGIQSGPILSATPQEIRDSWIPYYESKRGAGWGGPIADKLKQILVDFDNAHGLKNRPRPGIGKDMPLPPPGAVTTLPVRR